MTDIVAAARDYVLQIREQGYAKGPLPAEFDYLAEAVDDLPPVDAFLSNNSCTCPRCGKSTPLPLPLALSAMAPLVLYFAETHRWCNKS